MPVERRGSESHTRVAEPSAQKIQRSRLSCKLRALSLQSRPEALATSVCVCRSTGSLHKMGTSGAESGVRQHDKLSHGFQVLDQAVLAVSNAVSCPAFRK